MSGLVSKPDVVFKNGEIHYVGEVKSRKHFKAYQSDVIQMSVAKTILENQGKAVSDEGLLKIAGINEAKWIKVSLLNKNEVGILKEKYMRLQAGHESGSKCDVDAICNRCEYRDVC